MFSATSIILCLTFFNFLFFVQTTLEIPDEDSYGIVGTERAIRKTVNNLFSTLKVIKKNLKLKQYSTIHNFFASLTLRDHNNLKNITKLTQVDNIDNGTQVFITQLTEVLNEDNKTDEATDSVYVTELIEEFISRLGHLKETKGFKNNTKFDLNKAIIKYFSNNKNELENTTYHNKILEELGKENYSDTNVLSANEFWQPSGRRIFEGKLSGITQFPFMASVQFFKKFQCGGSILQSDLIITSASCLQLAWNNRFFRENPSFLSVRVGSTYYERGESIPVMEIHFHPDFNPKNLRHNLALMRLTRSLKFSKRQNKIKRIKFDTNPWPLASNVDGIVIVGWGARTLGTQVLTPWKNKLSYSTLDFYPLTECQEVYTNDFVTDRNFCAGFFSKGGGACNHDAGGPGVLDGILMGVISFGSPMCGTPDAPTVFTKLGYYAEWIEEVMEMDTAQGSQPTTLRSPDFAKFQLNPFTKKPPLKILPIIHEEPTRLLRKDPKTHGYDVLRKGDNKHEFKDFMKTIFKKKKEPKKQIEHELKESEKQPDDANEVTDSPDITQPEVKQFKPKQALRNKIETKTETKDKHELSSTSNTKLKRKDKIKFATESQSQSKENSEDKSTAVRPYTIFGNYKDKVTILDDNYDVSAETDSSSREFTPSFKQRNDGNEETSSDEEKEFDEAIENLIDDLNINFITETKKRLPAENVRKDPQNIKNKDQYPILSKEKSSREIENNNLKEYRENESDESNSSDEKPENEKSVSTNDEGEEEDRFNENRNNEKSKTDHKTKATADKSQIAFYTDSQSSDNYENELSEQVVHSVNKNNERHDYEVDDKDGTNENFESLSIPVESFEQENSSNNSTERLVDLMEYEDIYKLRYLSGHPI